MLQSFKSQLANFALRRSKLLSEEARLWQEVSEWIVQVEFSNTGEAGSIEQANQRGSNPEATLSPQQAAEFLGLSKQTLAKLRVYGGGPEYVKIGRRVVYRREALEAFLTDRVRPHTSSYSMPDQTQGRRVR